MAEEQSSTVVFNGEAVEYRDIPGFPGYRVGSDGSVWSCLKRVYATGVRGVRFVPGDEWVRKDERVGDTSGHLVASIRNRGHYVHRLVLLAFVGPCPDGMECRHLDDDPRNNRLSNLCWGTREQNIADRAANGRGTAGERSASAKLTEQLVRQMRAEHAEGGLTYEQLGKKYGIGMQGAWSVVKRKTWKHVA
jgi:hypothetical protein